MLEDFDDSAVSGVTVPQLSKIFGMPLEDVKYKLLGNIKPVGERHRVPVYAIKDAAPFLVSPPYSIEEFIKKMTLADLPTALSKEFWAGQRARLAYEKEVGESWPTEDVEEMIISIFNTLRQSLLLAREAVERETDLTKTQRKIVIAITDNTLKEINGKIVQFCKTKGSTTMATQLLESGNEGEEDL
jgi:hypothetical protein